MLYEVITNLQERENQIIITRNSKEDQRLAEVDTIPAQYFFLRGKVAEERREKPRNNFV